MEVGTEVGRVVVGVVVGVASSGVLGILGGCDFVILGKMGRVGGGCEEGRERVDGGEGGGKLLLSVRGR